MESWNPGFEFEECQLSYVNGYKRAFWQASHDHRGTVEQPGRVVTLVPAADNACYGLGFRITENIQQTLVALDFREKDGYERVNLTLYLDGHKQRRAITWIASSNHSSWRGGEAIAETAKIIATTSGPSGNNWDYLYKLHQSLNKLSIADEYVTNLVAQVATHRS